MVPRLLLLLVLQALEVPGPWDPARPQPRLVAQLAAVA
jgi:hypothetical protein